MTDLTYMDCWNYIAPLIPISSETSQDIYVMVFQALKEADERRNKMIDGGGQNELFRCRRNGQRCTRETVPGWNHAWVSV